jgi:hypothetical protein
VVSILVWWAIPAVAVLLAVAVLAVSRRIRRAREDVGALHRYQRAREALARTQHSTGQNGQRPNPNLRLERQSPAQAEHPSLPTTE